MEDNKMAEDVRKQLEERLRKSRQELTGDARKALTSGETAQRIKDRAEAQRDAPLYAFIAYDVTGSMVPYIKIVQDNILGVGRELFDNETGINLAVWGIGDHFDGRDWLQTNNFTSNTRTLDEQVRGIRPTSGGDIPEAYECLFKELARAASDVKTGHPTSKIAAIIIGDSIPHGMEYMDGDSGCPAQVDYRITLPHLKATADLVYLVGCSKDSDMVKLQRTLIDEQSPNQKYIPLGSMVTDLPALLIAAITQIRNPAHMEAYLKQLDSGQAGRVMNYLNPPSGR